ncbi:MAG: winged helix-turn-helix domain-containing tetratricopeptide repeat protein [Pyrinomonadaceae bacterium]
MSFGNLPNFFQNFSGREMSGEEKHFYRFKSFRLDVKERQLLHHGNNVPLSPKVFDVLVALVERSGHLVEKDELLKLVWADSFVEEVNVARSVYALRKVLGEDENGSKFIETVAKKGYRFVAKVTEMSEPSASAPVLSESPPQIGEAVIPPAAHPNNPTRIILFTVGFATAVFLILMLSFNFRSTSSGDPNEIRSIAVLPPKPLTAENRDSGYELGIADSLIFKIGSAKGIIVRSLNSTGQYTDIGQDPIAAGREQKVDYVLASNYQIADGKIRITSQLINVQSGLVEGSFKVEQENAAIFAVQDAVAANIVGPLLTKLDRKSDDPSEKRYTTNEEAYRLYIQGTVLVGKRNKESSRKAIEYLEQAVGLDPNYALAYARLAHAYNTQIYTGGTKNGDEDYLKAKAAIEKALALDPNLAEAHSYLGEMMVNYDADLAGAEREHKLAVALNPNSSTARRMYALLLSKLDRFDEAFAEIKTAIDLEPATQVNHLAYGFILWHARRCDEAITVEQRVLEMDPKVYFSYNVIHNCYRLKGEDDKAFEAYLQMQILDKDEPGEIDKLKAIYAKRGLRGISERELEYWKAAEKRGNRNYNHLAFHSIELGRNEDALAYLEKAFVEDRSSLVTLKVNPRYDPLRSDPRFDDLLERMGLK